MQLIYLSFILLVVCRNLQQQLTLKYGWNYVTSQSFMSQYDLKNIDLHIQLVVNQYAKLFICDSKPTQDLSQLKEIEYTHQCIYPINTKQMNKIRVSKSIYSHNVQLMFQTYSYKSSSFIIAIYSTIASQVGNLAIASQSQHTCLTSCNSGTCYNGVCSCPLGFIGSDCSVKLYELTPYCYLEKNQIYYIDASQVNQVQLAELYQFQVGCYYVDVNYTTYDTITSNIISLKASDIAWCQFNSLEVSNLLNNTIPLYFLIKEQKSVSEILNLTTFIVGGVLATITIGAGFLYCYYRQRTRTHLSRIHQQQIILQQELLDHYMPKYHYQSIKKEIGDNAECVVCLQQFEDSDQIRITYCKHTYHDTCISDWLRMHNTCPMCRSLLDEKALRSHYNTHEQSILSHKQESHQDNLII